MCWLWGDTFEIYSLSEGEWEFDISSHPADPYLLYGVFPFQCTEEGRTVGEGKLSNVKSIGLHLRLQKKIYIEPLGKLGTL
mgnify:FL=1